MTRSPTDATEVYQETINRLEPELHVIDEGAGWASIAISLKRIADTLDRIEAVVCNPIVTNIEHLGPA